MPIVEQPPPPRDHPPLKDDIALRPASLEQPNTEQPTINPEVEKCQPKIIHPESGSPLQKEVKPKHKPLPRPENPTRKSEYEADLENPVVEKEVLRQLLELDDDDLREFSNGMVQDYFAQAEAKFDEMDEQFVSRDLLELSSSGHFLKGSSAALGLARVQSTCEKIQHCGAITDKSLDTALSEEEILERLETVERLLKRGRLQYKEAKGWLCDFFDNNRSLEEVRFDCLGLKTLV